MHKSIEKEIIERFGFVPDFYRVLPQAIQDHAWAVQRDLEMTDGALDAKTKELIGLALAAHLKCRYCTYFHTKAARAHGADEEELREAIAMGGFTSMMSNALNGVDYDLTKFRQEVDRAVQHMLAAARPRPTAH